MLSAEQIRVSLFRTPDEFKDFNCEKQDYCDFVQKPDEAQKYLSENLGVTYVFRHETEIAGFVTLAMASLRKKDLPEERKKQKPFRDVPSLLLGHMARDSKYKGQGIGGIMMDWVVATAHRIGIEVGCRFVIVDAEEDVVERYQKYGFELIPPDKNDRTRLLYFDLGLRQASEPGGP
jgi:GNAT superfamily N-acetyltransferase